MRWSHAGCLVLLFLAAPVHAADVEGRLVQDIWNAAYMEGGKAGYVHTAVREVERNGEKRYRTTTRLSLAMMRNGATIQLRMDTGSEETADGKVTEVWMRQYQDDREQLVLKGTVKGGQLETRVEGAAQQQKIMPWDDRVIGLYKQERLFQEHPVKPGDQFAYRTYEPMFNSVVVNRVRVKDFEAREVFNIPKRLLRVETVSDKIAGVPLPGLTTWLDENLRPVRSEFELPQLCTIVLYLCSKEEALRSGTGKPDIAETSLIRINRRIDLPNSTRSAVYRITVKGDNDPASAFSQDSRQECTNIQGNTFELRVKATRPSAAAGPVPIKDEFLKSCYWIDSDDARIKAFAQRSVGKATDPWQQAKAIERWVHDHMHISYSAPFARASEVAKTLEGDCRQYGLLTTAICRAAGLPARTALGLCYAYDQKQGPVMAFHMWTEVLVRGEWVSIDATRGQGYVGATHLKITDNSWYDTQSLTPLLPVFRVLGKLSIEVVDTAN